MLQTEIDPKIKQFPKLAKKIEEIIKIEKEEIKTDILQIKCNELKNEEHGIHFVHVFIVSKFDCHYIVYTAGCNFLSHQKMSKYAIFKFIEMLEVSNDEDQ